MKPLEEANQAALLGPAVVLLGQRHRFPQLCIDIICAEVVRGGTSTIHITNQLALEGSDGWGTLTGHTNISSVNTVHGV